MGGPAHTPGERVATARTMGVLLVYLCGIETLYGAETGGCYVSWSPQLGSPCVPVAAAWNPHLQCPGKCIPKLYTSRTNQAPNRDPGMHAAISTLAHELTETATNPTGKSWINAKGKENADICAWRFG